MLEGSLDCFQRIVRFVFAESEDSPVPFTGLSAQRFRPAVDGG
jgi:hypothetical protein